MRRVVAGEHDGHRRADGPDRLRVINAATEEVRVEPAGWHPRRHLCGRRHVDFGHIDQRAMGRIAKRLRCRSTETVDDGPGEQICRAVDDVVGLGLADEWNLSG